MQKFKNRKEVRDCVKSILDNDEKQFPYEFSYCDGMGEPTYVFKIERLEADTFTDAKGQTWRKVND